MCIMLNIYIYTLIQDHLTSYVQEIFFVCQNHTELWCYEAYDSPPMASRSSTTYRGVKQKQINFKIVECCGNWKG